MRRLLRVLGFLLALGLGACAEQSARPPESNGSQSVDPMAEMERVAELVADTSPGESSRDVSLSVESPEEYEGLPAVIGFTCLDTDGLTHIGSVDLETGSFEYDVFKILEPSFCRFRLDSIPDGLMPVLDQDMSYYPSVDGSSKHFVLIAAGQEVDVSLSRPTDLAGAEHVLRVTLTCDDGSTAWILLGNGESATHPIIEGSSCEVDVDHPTHHILPSNWQVNETTPAVFSPVPQWWLERSLPEDLGPVELESILPHTWDSLLGFETSLWDNTREEWAEGSTGSTFDICETALREPALSAEFDLAAHYIPEVGAWGMSVHSFADEQLALDAIAGYHQSFAECPTSLFLVNGLHVDTVEITPGSSHFGADSVEFLATSNDGTVRVATIRHGKVVVRVAFQSPSKSAVSDANFYPIAIEVHRRLGELAEANE